MRTNVYIDGGNLYHGLLRYHPELKWLDLEKFVRTLVREDHEICSIKYFTSRIKTHPYDPKRIERQNVYLQVLASFSSVSIIEGYYQNSKKWLPAVFEKCGFCDQSRSGMLRIYRLEEKRTDVNLATEMIFDAVQNKADSFVLLSGDSDFIGPLDRIRGELGKQVVVFNPRNCKSDLMYHANYYRTIPADLAALCQLPDTVKVGSRTFVRPSAWAKSTTPEC